MLSLRGRSVQAFFNCVWRRRTFYRRTKSMVNRLTVISINSGLVTMITALLTIVFVGSRRAVLSSRFWRVQYRSACHQTLSSMSPSIISFPFSTVTQYSQTSTPASLFEGAAKSMETPWSSALAWLPRDLWSSMIMLPNTSLPLESGLIEYFRHPHWRVRSEILRVSRWTQPALISLGRFRYLIELDL